MTRGRGCSPGEARRGRPAFRRLVTRASLGVEVSALVVLVALPTWLAAPSVVPFSASGSALPGVPPGPLRPASPAVSVASPSVLRAAPDRTAQGPLATYDITFEETGLAPGTNWSVFLNRTETSVTSTVVFTVAPGSYYFVVPNVKDDVPSPSTGEVNVSGSNVVVGITFQPGYPVVFVALGLPAGLGWDVVVNGTDLAGFSTNNTVVITVGNGSDHYSVFSLTGCVTAPNGGNFTVSGGPTVEFVRFTRTIFPVVFSETGLPGGTNWSVLFDGADRSALAGEGIRINAFCGAFELVVGPVAAYSPVFPTAVIDVAGPTGYEVGFVRTPGFLNLPGNTGDYVLALLAGLTAAVVGAGVSLRRRP